MDVYPAALISESVLATHPRPSRPISMRHFVFFVVLLFTSVSVLGKQPISIASGASKRAEVNAELLVQVLRNAGFKAQIKSLDEAAWPDAIRDGKVHILPEISAADVKAIYGADLTAGRVVDMGPRQAVKTDPKFRKLAWSKTRSWWTSEYKLIKNMTIPEADTVAMLASINSGQSTQKVVANWIEKNKVRWIKWRSASRNWMKP